MFAFSTLIRVSRCGPACGRLVRSAPGCVAEMAPDRACRQIHFLDRESPQGSRAARTATRRAGAKAERGRDVDDQRAGTGSQLRQELLNHPHWLAEIDLDLARYRDCPGSVDTADAFA